MSSATVNYGIDLGTTNSAIARMTPKGAEIIPVRRQNYIPSAVAVSRRGDLKVGDDALKPEFAPVARWFKRLMGTSNRLTLSDDSEWSPERLSAEVLKALKAAAKLKTNDDLEDVVITIPAMFNQPQCAMTKEAARLAGLNAVVLLQEPIAAATAYLSEDMLEGYYLVYDLGGGTFDVSLVRLKDGEMNVVEHGGDNYLGGADFDRIVFDWVLGQIQRKGGDTDAFEDGADRHRLLQLCEEARIELSEEHTDSRPIYLDDFDLPITQLDLTRERLEALLEDMVTRTIEVSADRLKGRDLKAADMQAILLVGGPTQMPYIRRRLEQELGIVVNTEQDPLTVVARGAAIHAGTLLKGVSVNVAATAGDSGVATLRLVYEPVSPEWETSVAGKVESPDDFRGEVRVATVSGDWETGWQPLVKGAFHVDIQLGRTHVTDFRIELRDLSGSLVACTPEVFSIRRGIKTGQPVTPYNYGVVLEDGRVGSIVTAGSPLPAHGFQEFRLAKTLVAGSPEQVKIYIVEGDSPLADENVRVGELAIRGVDLRRTVKENERIEVRIRMDESRQLTAKVYIPLIDEEYAVNLHSFEDSPDAEDLAGAVVETTRAIREIEGIVVEEEQEQLLRASRQIEQLEALLERVVRGEVGEADRVHKQLSDTKASIRPLRDKYGLRAKHERLMSFIGNAEKLCQHFNDGMGTAKLKDLRSDADKFLRLEEENALDGVQDRVREIFWQHYGKTRECWEYQVQWMRAAAPAAVDPVTAFEIVRRAEQALTQEDFEGVSLQVDKIWALLPDPEKVKNRFYDAGLRK